MSVEAWLMAQPTPVNAASSTTPSLTLSWSVISSPQLGLCPLREQVTPGSAWRCSGLRLCSLTSSV